MATTTLIVGEHPLAAPLYAALSEAAAAAPGGGGAAAVVRHAPQATGGRSSEPWPDVVQHRGSTPAPPAPAVGAALGALLKGVDTVVILPVDPTDDPLWLDRATRGTYDVLRAAVIAGATKVVCLSSMAALFKSYPPDLRVDVQYAPRPSACAEGLSAHLPEFICREFARQALLQAVIARLGSPDCDRWPLSTAEAVASVVEVLSPGWRPVQRGDIGELTPPVDGDDPEDQFRDHLPWRYSVLHLHHGWPHRPLIAAAPSTLPGSTAASASCAPAAPPARNVLVLGGNGMLGPPVVAELSKPDSGVGLVVTDITRPPALAAPHRSELLSVTDAAGVSRMAADVDAIVNCAVLRPDRRLAFDVNVTGTFNAVSAAVAAGHRRFVNTGPHFSIVGQSYEDTDFGLLGSEPAHPGVYLYAITKGLGQEICRVFAANHPSLQVIHLMYYHFKTSTTPPQQEWTPSSGSLVNALAVTFADGARAVAAALRVDTAQMESNCEAFFIGDDMPNGRFLSRRTRKYLGWRPTESLAKYYSAAHLAHPKL
jgi:nucleoside-diphosphate-sugar epimerase